MDLKCYLFPGWEPRIRPAAAKREWMDEAPGSFPYRCLPLSIANSHGWDILSACAFEVEWNGGMAVNDVVVRADPGIRPSDLPVALFGQGTFTIHVQGLLRTPPGWNIYVGGPPNRAKDGVAPLSGIIETDWSPYTFTMNWQLTRANHPVRFEEGETIAHFFPVERSVIESVVPSFHDIDEDPQLKSDFLAWSKSRDEFQKRVREHPPERPTDTWQKLYYRGLMPDGSCPVSDHRSKLRVEPFARPTKAKKSPIVAPQVVGEGTDQKLARYEWLIEAMNGQRALSQLASGIFRVRDLTEQQFLDNFYALARPVVICGAIDDWPALTRWTPQYLQGLGGGGEVSVQRHYLRRDDHAPSIRFDQLVSELVEASGSASRASLPSCPQNAPLLATLAADLGRIDAVLADPVGEISFASADAYWRLEQQLANTLVVQIAGRTRFLMVAAADTPGLYDYLQGGGALTDITKADLSGHPRLAGIRVSEVVLEPGEALFVPVGWWRQATALEFGVSMACTGFRWRNLGFSGPAEPG